MTKEEILKDIDNLGAEVLFGFIQLGIVTLDELRKTRKLDHSKRLNITDMIRQAEADLQVELNKDKDAWGLARYGMEEDLRKYISEFPKGRYVDEAKIKIVEFQAEKERKKSERDLILRDLRENFKNHDLSNFKQVVKQYNLTHNELLEIGLPSEILQSLNKINSYTLNLGSFPKAIPNGFTEVYFWGSPGSGKTCALGSIIGTADKNGMLTIKEGLGFNYVTDLKNIFKENPVNLPPPTPFHDIQYLPIAIQKNKKSKPLAISLMEISGEIFECFYYKVAGLAYPSEDHKRIFENFVKIVENNESTNRKIHFFFIDYEKGGKLDSKRKRQDDYLSATVKYLNRSEVLDKSTDAIYLIVTKADLMPVAKDERINHAKEYLTSNFPSFVENLKSICSEKSINSDELLYDVFSIGDIYFKDLAILDSSPAENILEIFTDRVKRERFRRARKIFKG